MYVRVVPADCCLPSCTHGDLAGSLLYTDCLQQEMHDCPFYELPEIPDEENRSVHLRV